MTCEDAAARLPDDGPDVAEHLRGCASCRTLQEAYDRDADRLAAGLRTQAGPADGFGARVAAALHRPPVRTTARRIVPLVAAAAMLVGVLALIFAPAQPGVDPGRAQPTNRLDKPALLVIHGEEEGDLQIIPTDRVVSGQVVEMDEHRLVTVSVGTSDALAGGEVLAVYRRIHGGYAEVGTLRLLEVGESLSKGRMADGRETPRAGDLVVMGMPLSAAEKQALLEYVLSFRLRGADDHNPYAPLVRRAGLDHDVEFLSRLKDPRSIDRLGRILSQVAPFAKEGLPAGPDLSSRMHDWWESAKDRVRWDAGADSYVDLGK